MSGPFRPASRRTAQASGLCYPTLNFQTGSETIIAAAIGVHRDKGPGLKREQDFQQEETKETEMKTRISVLSVSSCSNPSLLSATRKSARDEITVNRTPLV